MQHVKNAIGWNAMKMLKMHQMHKNALECVWEESTVQHHFREESTTIPVSVRIQISQVRYRSVAQAGVALVAPWRIPHGGGLE